MSAVRLYRRRFDGWATKPFGNAVLMCASRHRSPGIARGDPSTQSCQGEDAVEHLEEGRSASRNECGRTPRRVGTVSASHPIGGFKPYSVDRPQPLRPLSSSTSRTPTCAILSRSRFWKRAASSPSSAARLLPYASDAWYVPSSVNDRLRNQLHPPLLQTPASPPAGGDTGGYFGAV